MALGLVVVGLAGLAWWRARPASPEARVEAGTARTLLLEARAALALDRSKDADRAFERAGRADPTSFEAWRGRLDRLRVLDRPLEALQLGAIAERSVGAESVRPIVALTTLAALAELPDDEARGLLDRWIAADPGDLDARVARLVRMAANGHPGDPDRASRIAELTRLLEAEPDHVATREALLVALGDAGEVDRGRAILEGWPQASRDAQFGRLLGRWDLDHDHRADRAAQAFAHAVAELPHDWRSHYGLARAYRALGREQDAQAEAQVVAQLRERLDPTTLGPRLAGDLARLDDPNALNDLAQLCDGVGLARLAGAWRHEVRKASEVRNARPADH